MKTKTLLLVLIGLLSLLLMAGRNHMASIPAKLFVSATQGATWTPWAGSGELDEATNALIAVSFEHHEIHEGDHYFYEDYGSFDNDDTVALCVQTPDAAKWTHIVWEIEAQGEIQFQIYEGGTVTFDGTDLTGYNNNRNSSNTSNWTNFEADCTVGTYGTLLGETSVGGATNPVSGVPGGGMRDRELVLKQNETYVFKITSGVNGNIITYLAEWYEHTNSN